MDEFEIIELSSPGKGGGKSWGGGGMGGERTCEPSVARRRWQDAIHQQLLLIRMDKENQLLKSKCAYVQWVLCMCCVCVCVCVIYM